MSPISAAARTLYGRDWPDFSRRIRFERAGGRCECMGQCGLHRTNPGPRRCVERHGEPAKWARGKVILTTAHLCHDPSCRDEAHVIAACQRCHLLIDGPMHRRHASETRDKKRGQGRLFTGQEFQVLAALKAKGVEWPAKHRKVAEHE